MGGQPMRPGSFNASDLNVNHQGLAHCLAHQLKVVDHDLASIPFDIKKAAAFMSDFFKDIPKERYIFFVESENDPRVTRRNPLEGSYPYGRTGRTPRDPLQGFMHFKYSKKGTPVVRLIKPGKFTPFYPTETGDAANPYQETGSKLERQPNGKYRHIASHRLDELIALGWDGATYTSAKGKHEAVGLRVPFIVGYDSDSDDEYERIDVTAGKLAGTVGLSPEEKGSYMAIPNMGRPGERQLVRIQK